MKYPSALFAILAFIVLSSVAIQPAAAQQNLSKAKNSYGVVKSIGPEGMIVTVYDEKKDETTEETFILNPDTELVIVQPADELIEGDEIQITYVEEKKKKVSKFISIMDMPVPPPPEEEAPPA